jgi:hypothetical protein
MNSKLKASIKTYVFAACLILTVRAQAQLYVGIKSGTHMASVDFADKEYMSSKMGFVPGFDVGSAINISIGQFFELYNEMTFSLKGAAIRTTDSPQLHRWTLGYIDSPILLRTGIYKGPHHDLFIQMGPTISYWCFGQGKSKTGGLDDVEGGQWKYHFKWKETSGDMNEVFVPEANRIQLGLNFGVGGKLKFRNKHIFLIDVRYEWGNTYLSRFDYQDDLNEYTHNFNASTRAMKLSAAYLLNVDVLRKKYF